MSGRQAVQLTITRTGLVLWTVTDEAESTHLQLDAKQALELLQALSGKRDLLLAGACPRFDLFSRSFPCPQCRSMTRLESEGIRWRGACAACGESFELDATGDVLGNTSQKESARRKR